jgi:beta-glucanase (GH16 family)
MFRWDQSHRAAFVFDLSGKGPMKRILLTAAVLLSLSPLAAVAQKSDPAIPPAIAGRGYHLVKNWDFGTNVTTLDALHQEFWTRYVYDNGTLDHLTGNGEWERYRDNDNHRFADHTLELVAQLRGGLHDSGIESGMLRSKWTGKYGYFEIRMKVPHGRGLWPAFWLNPQDGNWPPEIDVVEIVDNGRDTTRNSFHNLYASRPEDQSDIETKLDRWGSYRTGVDLADDFHVFAVEWTPESVIHYLDGKKIAERRFAWVHKDGSDAGPAHVLVNLAVGGKWPGPPDSSAEFPAILRVSYIRVWQK